MSGEPGLLAVDLGGTSIKGALVDMRGRTRVLVPVPSFAAGDCDVLGRLLGVLDRLREQAPAHGLRVDGAGIVVPGLVDESGFVTFAANLGWRDVDLRGAVERHLRLPVAIGHDVRASGLAESLLGVAREQSHFVMVTIGTGIAAALMSDGRLVAGVTRGAGELGHIPVIPDGEACACGQRGCLETYASASAIARRYHAIGGREVFTAADIAARLATDERAARVWADAVRALSLALATTTLLLDPALIVLGGGLSRAGGTLLDPVRDALAALLAFRPPPAVALSALGAAAGRIGAAVLGARLLAGEDAVAGWTLDAALREPA